MFNPSRSLQSVAFLSKSLIAICFFLFVTNSVRAQNIPVPENIQAALLSKVLKFNPELQKNDKIKMLVIYDNKSQINKDEFINGLEKSIEVLAIKPDQIEKNISGYNVVYFMSGLNEQAYRCKTRKLLSVTGINKYVEEGEISLGFGIENNKPKILVNITSLDMEGQSFSSEILRIAKIFK